ncbi:MAG: tripartite tricarboxylate transporter TctB family protein [Microbacterium sp.]
MSTSDAVIDTGSDSARPSRAIEIAFAAVALMLTASYLVLGTQIELRQAAAPGQIDARFWPLLLGTSGVGVSIALLVIALTRPAPSREEIERIQPGGVARVVVTSLITIAYVALWSVSSIVAFGYRIEIFPIITALYMFALLLVYGQRRWLGLVIYPLAVTAFIYVLFGMLLRIPL